MSSLAARILDALDPTAAAKAAAITGQQSPTVDQLAADSAASAELFGSGDAEGTPVPPVWEPAAPVLTDITDTMIRAVRSMLLRPPVPAASASFTARPDQGGVGLPVQVVPASGGRPRTVTIRNASGSSTVVRLYTERSGSSDPSTPPEGGYLLPDGAELVTTTQGPVFAAGLAAWAVTAWVDTYPAPVAEG